MRVVREPHGLIDLGLVRGREGESDGAAHGTQLFESGEERGAGVFEHRRVHAEHLSRLDEHGIGNLRRLGDNSP